MKDVNDLSYEEKWQAIDLFGQASNKMMALTKMRGDKAVDEPLTEEEQNLFAEICALCSKLRNEFNFS